jgi:hypothetical protein
VKNVAALWRSETPLHLDILVSSRDDSHFLERDMRGTQDVL